MSRLHHSSLSTERRLMRMVEQNGGKLRRLKKIIEKWRFVGIQKFLRGTSLLSCYHYYCFLFERKGKDTDFLFERKS